MVKDRARGGRAPARPSVTDGAIAAITGMIAAGHWRPGDRLPPESGLAAQLGLSRSSLREAVRALTLFRVLDVRRGDGTYVSSLEPRLLMDSIGLVTQLLTDQTTVELFEVRRVLEPAAAAMAAVRIGADQRQRLHQELDRMISARTVEDLVDADAAFHRVIAQASGNSVLAALLESLSTQTMRARLWRARTEEGVLDATRAEHARIYEAVVAGDAELARVVSGAHVANSEHWLRTDLQAAAAQAAT